MWGGGVNLRLLRITTVTKALKAGGWNISTSEFTYRAKEYPELTDAQRDEVTSFLHEPRSVDLSPSLPSSNVAQMIYPISRTQKEALLQAIFESASIASALIFPMFFRRVTR